MMKKSREKIKRRRGTRTRKRIPRLGREETERRIIELYKDGATFPEIAAECHSSATTIKKVVDRYEKQQVPQSESKRSAALRLLNQGCTPFQVAVRLDLSAEEIRKYQLELMDMNNMDYLVKLYSEIEEDLSDFITFYKSCKFRGLVLDDLDDLEWIAKDSDNIKAKYERVSAELRIAERNLSERLPPIKELTHQESALENKVAGLSKQVKELERELVMMQSLIDDLRGNDKYQDVIRIIEDEVKKILDSNNILLEYAAISILRGIIKDPSIMQSLHPRNGQLYQPDFLIQKAKEMAEPFFFSLRSKIEYDMIENTDDALKQKASETSI